MGFTAVDFQRSWGDTERSRPMAAFSGFYKIPGPPPLGDVRGIAPSHRLMLNTHISELDTQLYPIIPKWSLTYVQAANLPGYYETRTNTTIPITNSHNFSNVLSTMRVFLVCLV